MPDPSVEDEINLRDYWRVLVRRRFLIFGITFVVAVLTAVFTLLQPNIYQSRATLMPLGKSAGGIRGVLGEFTGLVPLASLSQENSSERILAILNSRILAEEVIQRLDLLPRLFAKNWNAEKQLWMTDDPPTMLDAVHALRNLMAITFDRKAGIIIITTEYTDPDLAAAIANQHIKVLQSILDDKAFSLAKKNRLFIESQLQQTRQALKASEEALRSFEQKHGIVSLDTQTAASVFSLNQAPEVKLRYARLQREELLQNKLFMLLVEQLEQAKIKESQDETVFQVLDQAIRPNSRLRPKPRRNLIISIVVGVFAGIFVAFFREYQDNTIRTREQVERQTGLSLLATIPSFTTRRRFRLRSARAPAAELLLQHTGGSPIGEAYRYLFARFRRLSGGHSVKTVLIASPGPDEIASDILVNLGIVAANLGERTLLVDSNVYFPTLHSLLQCSIVPGLIDVLSDIDNWQKGIHTTKVRNLWVLPAGKGNTETFLESKVFDTLLIHLKETYDLIFFVAPPVIGSSDAAVLGGKVDATCITLHCGVSRINAIEDTKSMLNNVQVNIIGAILRN